MSYNEQLRTIANQYYEDASQEPATVRHIAAWAIREGLWRPRPADLIDRCADELARAMREEHITDPQGRSVRAKHVARVTTASGEQLYLWADIRVASREF